MRNVELEQANEMRASLQSGYDTLLEEAGKVQGALAGAEVELEILRMEREQVRFDICIYMHMSLLGC